MPERLSPERLEEIRDDLCPEGDKCAMCARTRGLLSHIDAVEAELAEAIMMRQGAENNEGYILADAVVCEEKLAEAQAALAASQARELGLRRALERVLSLGHNDDCLFCGFKDNQARIALALPAPDLGERP